jgi:hypothetical protein
VGRPGITTPIIPRATQNTASNRQATTLIIAHTPETSLQHAPVRLN